MRKAILAIALAAALAACGTVPVPQDQAQTVYALEGAYQAAANVEVKYIQSSVADAGAVSAMKKADQAAFDALTAAQKAVQSGAGDAAVAAAVAAAQDALDALTSLLHAKGLI
jgi:hypothetical protein